MGLLREMRSYWDQRVALIWEYWDVEAMKIPAGDVDAKTKRQLRLKELRARFAGDDERLRRP